MKSFIFCLLLCATFVQAQTTSSSRLKVGNEYPINYHTGHPYNTTAQTGVIFEQEFYNKNSAYIKLYFEDFDLGPEDYVEISTHNTGESIIYAGQGKIIDGEGTMISDFWSMALFDDRVTVRLHAQAPSNHHGFKISQVAYGYTQQEIDAVLSSAKAICGADNKERIACYSGTAMFSKGRAVCRLLINGSSLCTGWLLGSQGHIMTNNHCVGNSTSASNTDFLFNYQYSSCSGSSSASSSVVASSSTFIKTSTSLDYTLLRLPTNPTGTYGYLQLQPTAPVIGDRLYIVGHPGGRRKEITVRTDQGGISAPSGLNYAAVDVVTTNGIRYFADTEGGSSGSPVLSYNTNQVISIHNTGSCSSGNGSSGRCDRLITDIGSSMPLNGVGGSSGGGPVSCVGTVSSYPYTESFESGLGAWRNVTGEDFDWTRKTGSTSSLNTGPSAAAVGSYYMYTESSYPNYSSKVAHFVGPCFNLSSILSPQISFRYHMYGAAMGDLKLQASTNGTSWSTIWSKAGDQGNSWKSATVSLNAYTSATQLRLRFVGTTGSSYTSDMAIDYIRVQQGIFFLCNSSFPLLHGFESGFDGWVNASSGDDFNWTRKSGSTPSSSTGPTAAAGGSYYIYTESSNPNYGGKDAIITSPCQNLNALSSPAVRFSYHMYGSSMGTLRLQVSVNNGAWSTIWSKTGDQGNSWKSVYLNVGSYKSGNTKFRFHGTTGSSFRSDMAVDNFRIQEGLIIIDPPFDDPRILIEDAPVTLDEVKPEPFLSVFPNPFNDQINIETNIEGLTNYRLTNMQGQIVKEANLQGTQVQLVDLVPGVYFITVYNEQEHHVRKIIKQ